MNQESSQRQEIIANFFDLVAQNQAELAVERIFADMSSWVPRDSIIQIRQQLLSLNQYLGNFIGYEYLGFVKLSERYAIDHYFCYYDRQPILYEFTLYRPNTNWRVQNINFQSEFESIIAKAPMSWQCNS